MSESTLNCCSVTRAPIAADDPIAIQLGSEQYLRWIDRGFQGPLEWRPSWGSSRASGYERNTELQLGAHVEGMEHAAQRRLAEPSNPFLCNNIACNDYLELKLQVTLAAADGSIAGKGQVMASSANDAGSLLAFGELPIDDFVGTLELGSDAASPREGGVLLNVRFSEMGAEGIVVPWIGTAPVEKSVDAPLIGSWPVPTCIYRGVPLDVDTPIDSLGRTPRELLGDIGSSVSEGAGSPAIWNDGSSTQIEMEFIDDIRVACAPRLGSPVYLTTPARLVTADGRIDAVLDAEFVVAWDDVGPLNWRWSVETTVMDGVSLASLIGGIDMTSEAEVMLEVRSGPDFGGIRISRGEEGRITEPVLNWCTSSPCPRETPVPR